jgi:hypothetical protein
LRPSISAGHWPVCREYEPGIENLRGGVGKGRKPQERTAFRRNWAYFSPMTLESETGSVIVLGELASGPPPKLPRRPFPFP